ncbi:PAS domain-containing sensor histidine kinase [Desulfospira joergensenii]|uniref:PAS domain-containing sensor histidine kinase n=1 Tax=Desulfospira joergensenii TaxID=53329 RepID=UPI0003B58221|nr:PAS domain-containing sensor histidine kinase [Desulfospira joergensenii]
MTTPEYEQNEANPDPELYRSLIDNSPDLFYRTDIRGLITYVSASVYPLSGYTVEEAVGMNMAREIYLFPEKREAFLKKLQEAGQVKGFEAQLKKKDGTIWWASTNARFYKDKQGRILGVEGMTRDITDVKEAGRALFESKEKFRLAFHTSPDSINLNRLADGMFIDINQGFTDLTGYTRDDVQGKTSSEINIWKNPEDRKKLIQNLQKTGHVRNMEAQFVRKNGEIAVCLMSAGIMRINEEDVILSITRDITEHKRTQEMMVQTEKMISVGGLAAGMAHELNNPLAGVIQNINVLSNRLTSDAIPANVRAAESAGTTMESIQNFMEARGVPRILKAITESGSRMASLITNILSFARKTEASFSSHDPVELIEKVLDLAHTDYDLKTDYDFKSIVIQKEFQDNLPMIPCEGNKIQQVLLNILNNGAHAMFERDMPGDIPAPKFIIRLSQKTGTRMLQIEIEDNGVGMDKATSKKIFEPFFTTKPPGVGTGLGLSVSYFIITENHKGTMDVISQPGRGTNFIICLPIP